MLSGLVPFLCASHGFAQDDIDTAGLEAVYADAGRVLRHVSRADAGETLLIDSPLWIVTVGGLGNVLSTEFEPRDGEDRSFIHKKSGLVCKWESTAEGNSLRHAYTLEATRPVNIERFAALLVPNTGFTPGGTVLGSPLVSGDGEWFAGMEHPMARTANDIEREIGTWDTWMLTPREFVTVEYPLPDRLVAGLGPLEITFDYQSGPSRLDIRRVALLAGDGLISEDTHAGFAGTPSSDNTYTLDLSALPQDRTDGPRILAEIMAQDASVGSVRVGPAGDGLFAQDVACAESLEAGESIRFGSVIAHSVSGSLRRGMLEYIEASRARPYGPFLHYNSWYDIADQNAEGLFVMDSDQCLDVMAAWDRDFMTPHGVTLDSFVFDDGWDDPNDLWAFHPERFPEGFSPQAQLAKEIGTHIGVWFSPFGGYGSSGNARREFGAKSGYETNRAGLSLAGPKYYQLFRDRGATMIQDYEVNYFKYDGIGAGALPDMAAAYRLMAELREIEPGLYINLTTGTWGSPFFLLHGDSIWRGGGDALTWGDGGPMTHRLMNYRDGETYKNIVRQAPLFPLNSLMLCGVVHSRLGLGRDSVDETDKSFADQAFSFFATGTQLQELYVSHAVMTQEKWRILAEAVRWSRANKETLRDTHWIGGNPYALQVYGHASFDYRGRQAEQPHRAIVCLRNPAGEATDYELSLTAVTEWPMERISDWEISRKVYGDAGITVAGDSIAVALPPYSVVLLELSITPHDPEPAAP